MDHIYVPPGYNTSYKSLVTTLYNVNSLLNSNGVIAPSEGSLKHTRLMYEAIGSPLDRIYTIHIGGTNGKGTTSFKTASCLIASGYTTGLFVSPHLSSFRERIQVNGKLVSEEEIVESGTVVCKLCAENKIPATVFEITFIMACYLWQKHNCDVVVLEVGLGGLLDATNVVQTAISLVCSISLDHTRILGSTVEEIAQKKAGIFKEGIPAIIGPSCPFSVMEKVALDIKAQLYTLNDVTNLMTKEGFGHVLLPSCSDCDEIVDTDNLNGNLCVATLFLLKRTREFFSRMDMTSENFQRALRGRPPCRWELCRVVVDVGDSKVEVETILDVAHNPAAVSALVRRIKRDLIGRDVFILYAVSRDKDVKVCLMEILRATTLDRIFFAQSNSWRSMSASELISLCSEEVGYQLVNTQVESDVRLSVRNVLKIAANSSIKSVVVICGTGFIMPSVREEIGIVEPRD